MLALLPRGMCTSSTIQYDADKISAGLVAGNRFMLSKAITVSIPEDQWPPRYYKSAVAIFVLWFCMDSALEAARVPLASCPPFLWTKPPFHQNAPF